MIVLLSGGLDSIATWRLLGLPNAVNFDLNTTAAEAENRSLRWAREHFGRQYHFLPKMVRAHLPMQHAEAANGYVEFRNSILILMAGQYDPDVVLGAVAEYGPDKNKRFYKRLERAANMRGAAAGNTAGLRVLTPYADLSKGELLWLYDLSFGKEETRLLLDNTWSCYLDEEAPCLKCGGCRQRIAAEHQYAKLSGAQPPPYTAARWRIPWRDRVRWIASNGWLGVKQIRAHTRQDAALPAW